MALCPSAIASIFCYQTKITRKFYRMSIPLTTLSLAQSGLNSIEKFILVVLCFRANQNKEAWSSIERLAVDTGYSKNTIEKYLKRLRDKNILIYTGKYKGESGKIPIYRINLDHPTTEGDKIFITPYENLDHPTTGSEITPPRGVHKDNMKNNKKDIDFSYVKYKNKRIKKHEHYLTQEQWLLNGSPE